VKIEVEHCQIWVAPYTLNNIFVHMELVFILSSDVL
jgi:hypothetical protein